MRTPLQLLIVVAALFSGGCSVLAYSAVEQIDRAVSKVAQSDCEVIRVVHGEDICIEREAQKPDPVYCYRRLGEVDCYARRDPHDAPIVNHEKSRVRMADTASDRPTANDDLSVAQQTPVAPALNLAAPELPDVEPLNAQPPAPEQMPAPAPEMPPQY